MKKHLKAAISMLLALVLLVSVIPASAITASAAGKLSIDVDYDYYGTAFVTITPGDSDNYVTYTTDGTMPGANSEKYTNEIVIYSSETLRVAEYNDDGERVKGLKMTVTAKTAPVIFDIKQLGDKAEVTLTCATANAEIRYTTDGTKPSRDSELYTDKLVLTEKTKIRARAYCDNYKTTTTYAKTVKITPAEDLEEETKAEEKAEETIKKEKDNEKSEEVAAEKTTSTEKVYDDQKISHKITYMDDGRTYVALTPAKSGYTIRYTTDGSVPSKESKKYSSRIKFEEPSVLRARQYNSKGQCVGTIKMNVKIKCADVVYSCLSMDTGIREIAMSTSTEGATIYYTTNTKSPKGESGRIYTEPIFVSEYTDIMAYAVKDGYKDSSVNWEIAGRISMPLNDFNFNDPAIKAALDKLNNYRLANGCPTMVIDKDLTKAAYLRAKELSIHFSTKRPNGGGAGSAATEVGVAYTLIGEFIERSSDTAEEFIDKILSDSANRTHLVSDTYEYDKIGIGHFKTETGSHYWSLLVIKD